MNNKEMIFNIYYVNFPKVYEIKMMLNNSILSGQQIEKDRSVEGEAYLKTKLGFNIMDIFKLGDVDAGGNIKGAGSKKVLETFEIKTTKSVILNEIVEKSKKVSDLKNIKEGELIQINNVNLSLENEAELRTVKLVTSGSFKGLSIPDTHGLDINNLFNSMFKDYAYKMKGSLDGSEDDLLVKIPFTFENEFESSYSVDDLFIGKVSIIGLYKGKIKIDQLRNSFEFYKDLGELTQLQNTGVTNKNEEIQDSQYKKEDVKENFFASSQFSDKEFHYIDLLAIVQNISIPE
jgi:hypothetical protein